MKPFCELNRPVGERELSLPGSVATSVARQFVTICEGKGVETDLCQSRCWQTTGRRERENGTDSLSGSRQEPAPTGTLILDLKPQT